ncbi:MAG: hypothetical protein ABSD20_13770 [Terriglobales bacterium]
MSAAINATPRSTVNQQPNLIAPPCNLFANLSICIALIAGLIMCSPHPLCGQTAPAAKTANARPTIKLANGLTLMGIAHDSSLQHAVASDPGTEEDAIRRGKHEDWLRIVNDPKYIIQQMRRGEAVRGPHAAEVDAIEKMRKDSTTARTGTSPSGGSAKKQMARNESVKSKRPQPKGKSGAAPDFQLLAGLNPKLKRAAANNDWSMGMLSSTGVAADAGGISPNNTPVDYASFGSAHDCTNDYTAFVTGRYDPGSNAEATIVGFNNLYSGCSGTSPHVYFSYEIEDPTSGNMLQAQSSPAVDWLDGSQLAFMVSDNYGCGTCSASSSLVVLRWAGNPSNGTQTQGTIAAPKVLNSGTGYVSPISYATCTAPCYTIIRYTDSTSSPCNSTNANYTGICNSLPAEAPYYDLNTDWLFVGDNQSNLHHFTNIFGLYSSAGPAEDLTGDWPAFLLDSACSSPLVISSPIYDAFTGDVFAGTSGGCTNVWAVQTTNSYGGTGTGGMVDNESTTLSGCNGVVDSLQYDFSTLFLYATSDNAPYACGRGCTHYMDTIWQFNITGTGGLAPSSCCPPLGTVPTNSWCVIGTGTKTGSGACNATGYHDITWDGQFDNVFEQSGTSTGYLYAAGNHNGPLTLYQCGVTAGVLPSGNATTVTALMSGSGTTGYNSAVNEFCNNAGSACTTSMGMTSSGADLIAFSLWKSNVSGCTNSTTHGCVLQYDVSDPTIANIFLGSSLDWPMSSATPMAPTGTLDVDNYSTFTGASNWYFTSTDIAESCATNSITSPCAVQWPQY